jgi:hypothetical protein
MFGEINAIRELATKYSKPQLANLAQTGQIEPQKAVLAGMMIDRIAKSAMAPPQTTVAQDVLGVQGSGTGTMAGTTLGTGGQQLGPTAPPPQAPPQMAAHGGLMGMLPQSHGVAALHSGLHDMAGGGIVAFAGGGDIPGYADRGLTTSEPQPTYLPNNIDFERGNVPVYRTEAPKEVTLASSAEQRKAAETQAGIDPKFYETLKNDVLKDKEDFTKQRDEAKGMAALQFGLGLMGARKGQEFQTASAAGQQALAQYGSTLKDIKLSEKEMKKDLRQLTMAEQAYKQSNSDKDQAKVDMYQNKLQDSKESYTKALNDGVRLKEDLFKVKTQSETQLKTAQIGKEGTLGAATISARSHEKIAGMPGDQQKLLMEIQAFEAKKNPDNPPSLLDVHTAVHSNTGKADARARASVAFAEKWNTASADVTGLKLANLKKESGAENVEDFVRKNMEIYDTYYPRGIQRSGAATPPPGGATSYPPAPPAAIDQLKANANAANRAFFDSTFGPGAAAKALGK